jgi:phosphinothricin acetyltransferase
MMIREMEKDDWERVSQIYIQGLERGIATFETVCPSYEDWDNGHLPDCRYVAVEDGNVVGWIALSSTSTRPAYRGSVEVSIYVDEAYQRKSIGYELMQYLIATAPENGIWSLYAAIFSINAASIGFHRKCRFREIGYRERIAKDRFGQWQNTTLMELRL